MQDVDPEAWVSPPLRFRVVCTQVVSNIDLCSKLDLSILGIWLKLISLLDGAIFSPG
jgi:hypothetical protein